MQLFIKSDSTAVLRINDLSVLPDEIARLTHISTDALSLSSGGRPLRTIEDFQGLSRDDTVHVVHRVLGGAVKKRCQQSDCTAAALRNLNCSLCAGQFCAKHRLLEQHACSGLASCKDELRRANQAKLESERCVAPKVV